MRFRTGLSVVATTAVVVGGMIAAPVTAQDDGTRIAVVVHGEPSSRFWAVVKAGAEEAGKELGATVDYYAPTAFDMVQVAQLIDTAVATEPDGISVAVADPDALGPSIKKAIEAGIPVITMNSGLDAYKELGALTHVGSDETVAGAAAGQRLADSGVKNALCLNDEVGNIATDLRCEKATEAIAAAGGKMEVLPVPLGDPIGIQAAVAARLQADPTIDATLSQGPDTAVPALAAVKEAGMVDKVHSATFDLGVDTLNALIAGEMDFAVDQQQYLQGYLPVVLLTLYNRNLNTVANPVIMTGPGFVTQDNAERVIALAEAGTR